MNATPLVSQTSEVSGFPRWSETLHDRSRVLIRPINKLDHDAERAFIEGLSPESRHFRFLGAVGHPSERMLDQFTDIDPAREAAFVAVVPVDSHERIVGVSRLVADDDGLNCECAVTVSDDWQNKGLGTVLMKHLIEVARARGLRTMISIDSFENMEMKELARHLGFQTRVDPDDARQVIHELAL
ncbi:MAG: GNAT family N-acetyltransferase [Arenimonas sp.]|jgi:GNAT superfamily N-acetyltransferase